MKTLSEIKGLLKGRNLAQVGRAVGLSRAYILRIKQGQAKNPSYETVRKLSEYLEGEGGPRRDR